MTPQISLTEELAANALPPAVVQVVDGWRLRYNFGVTRRANSVLASEHGGALHGRGKARAHPRLLRPLGFKSPLSAQSFLATFWIRRDAC